MAYKDEYEVARLYTDGTFEREIRGQFDGKYRLEFNLAPPLFARRDPVTGELRKRTYGPWMLKAFGMLASLRKLRGTMFDPFGYTAERREERRMIDEYRSTVEGLLRTLSPDNYGLAVEIASLPQDIRGYGHVKDASIERVKAREHVLLDRYAQDASIAVAAE
jgi:indolepyruvate ferredoxin oxidoreductase